MLNGIMLVLLGIVAVPSLLLSKKPDAKELLDKITPYQGWGGVFFCLWGVWGLISCILSLGLISTYPIYWIILLVVSIDTAALGFILGYSLIASNLLAKNDAAKEKGEKLLQKLLPLQGTLGIIAIIIGLLQIVSTFIWVVK